MLNPLKTKPTPSLEDRIREVQRLSDEFIDQRAVAIAAESPGVPLDTIRNILMARVFSCQCRGALAIIEGD